MLRRTLFIAVLSLTLSGLALARTERIRISAAGHPWRIHLAGPNDNFFLSKDQPVARGSMLVFHGYPDGRLIAIPQEQVVRIEQGAGVPFGDVARVAASRVSGPLQPGEVRVIGDTGGGSGAATLASGGFYSPSAVGSAGTSGADPGRLATDALVFRGDTTVAGGTGGGTGASPYGTAGGMVLNPTLATPGVLNPTLVNTGVATGTGTTTLGPNGFPTTVAAQPVNPNGFPATTLTGSESGTQPINPNGFPATTTTGSQSGIQPVGPNGFPTLETPASAGNGRSSTQPRAPSSR
jgi:hypothetical protein